MMNPNCVCYNDSLLVLYVLVFFILVYQTVFVIEIVDVLCIGAAVWSFSFVYRGVACDCGYA